MAALGVVSLARLSGVKEVTRARANALADYLTSIGGDLGIAADGGLRTMARQAELVKYRDDSVAAGGGYYAVHSPNKNARHTTGDAFDIHLYAPADGMTDAETYKTLADYAQEHLNLRAGYYFSGHSQDVFHFENSDAATLSAPTPTGTAPLDIIEWIVIIGLAAILFLHYGS